MQTEVAWICTDELAQIAGMSPQAARRAARHGLAGTRWRGAALQVQYGAGRGGRSGLSYQIAVDSLPAEVREKALRRAAPTPMQIAHRQDVVIRRRWAAIADALDQPYGSAERAEAIETAALRAGRHPRTIRRWVERYDQHGLRGLGNARPSNAGARRVLISRTFDQAARTAGLNGDVLKQLEAELDKALRGLWASRAEQAGSSEIRRLAAFLLRELCEGRGLRLPEHAFSLSRRRVERFAHYRALNRMRNDRKGFDNGKPRIRRDWTELDPMERVVADVKHLDVIVRRPDGTPAWPKIVAFMDMGTSRVFAVPFLLERGEGVRQEHVIEAFIAMVSDPSWGFPRGLYLDNGSEFGALLRIESALNMLGDAGVRTILYAKPYNASAKPIESLFARLDRYAFSLLPGYAGPDRLSQKTQTVGKPPAPFPGSWEVFSLQFAGLIHAFNQQPLGERWRRRSAADWFEQKVSAGWRPAIVEPAALNAAFCDRDNRRVDRGVIRWRGDRYTHPALAKLPHRTIVDLAAPWRRGAAPLARIPELGWVPLQRQEVVPARWIEGARTASRSQKDYARATEQLAADVPTIDPVAAKIRWGEARAKALPPPAFTAKLDLGETQTDLARGLTHAPSPASRRNAHEQRLMREMARTARLERKQKPDE